MSNADELTQEDTNHFRLVLECPSDQGNGDAVLSIPDQDQCMFIAKILMGRGYRVVSGTDNATVVMTRTAEQGATSSTAPSFGPPVASQTNARDRADMLTLRERQVMDLVVSGLANKLIAYKLSISPRTVENHRARVMRKMGAKSLAELVRMSMAVAA
jgi:FixJ family two-component response regulator